MSASISSIFPPSHNDSIKYDIIPWHITSFTEEIIGLIGTWSGLEAVIRLFTSGSLILRQKLSSARCCLELQYTSHATRLWSPLPPCLNCLKGIISISIEDSRISPSVPSAQHLNWSALPNTLKSLQYTHSSCFYMILDLTATLFPTLTSLTLNQLEFDAQNVSPSASFTQGLPSLRHLSLTSFTKLPFSFTSSFPSSLESLSLNNFIGTFNMNALSKAPQLTKLEIPQFTRVVFHIPCFPFQSAITTLNIADCSILAQHVVEADPKRYFFSSFPALSSLTLNAKILDSMVELGTVAPELTFWPTLTCLKVEGRVSKEFAFPPRLLSLSLNIKHLEYPERLPRTLLSLTLHKARLVASKFMNLPPKLSKLVLDTNEQLSDAQRPGDTAKWALPPSVTLIMDHNWHSKHSGTTLPSTEYKFIAQLPETVLSYLSSQRYVRLPENLQKKGMQGRMGRSKLLCFNSAIMASNIAFADYCLLNWQDEVVDSLTSMLLQAAISNEAVKSVSWIIQKKRRFLGHSRALDFHEEPLEHAFHCFDPLPILDAILKGGFPKEIFQAPSFIHTAVKRGSIPILQWIEDTVAPNWDASSETMTSLTAILTSLLPLKTLDFLFERGARLIEPTQMFCASLRDRTLAYWKRAKQLSTQHELFFERPLDSWAVEAFWSSPDLIFMIDILEWMMDPSNGCNVPIERRWLETLLPGLFHVLCIQITSTQTHVSPSDPFMLGTSRSRLTIPEMKHMPVSDEKMAKIRNFDSKPFNPSQLLVLGQFLVKQGVDIFAKASKRNESNTLLDAALFLNNLEFLTFLASLPGHGFLAAISTYTEAGDIQNQDIIVGRVVEKAILLNCDPTILSFLDNLQNPSPISEEALRYQSTRETVDLQSFPSLLPIGPRVLFQQVIQ